MASSVLLSDIKDIQSSPKVPYSAVFTIKCKLHTVTRDLTNTEGVVLNNIYIIRDYVTNLADYIEAQLVIPYGTYLYDVYPNLNNVEVTLITTKQLSKSGKPFTVTTRYKAAYLLDKNENIPTIINQSRADLDLRPPVVIIFQLVHRSAEALRIKTTQGNFDKTINKNKDMSIGGFLQSIISEQTNKVLIDGKQSIQALEIEKPDNTIPLKAVTIPSATRIVDIPGYIQNSGIGIYTGGAACYIQEFGASAFNYKTTFFIYSLYNTKKYKESEFKTIFYLPKSSAASMSDYTYIYKDKILRVLPHTAANIQDNRDVATMSSGGGYKLSNANSYMKKPVVMTDTGPKSKKEALTSEVIASNRPDGLNYASNKGVGGNQFKHISDILKTAGNYITLTIDNIDHDFIYPGAKCKIMTEGKDNKLVELFGVIHRAVITYSNPRSSLLTNYHVSDQPLTSRVVLHIFCMEGNINN